MGRHVEGRPRLRESGEPKSVKAAARAAGIVRPTARRTGFLFVRLFLMNAPTAFVVCECFSVERLFFLAPGRPASARHGGAILARHHVKAERKERPMRRLLDLLVWTAVIA